MVAIEKTQSSGSDDRAVDRESIERMAKGDPGALGDVYDRHIRAVFGLAMRITQDQGHAQEVVRGVFSQAWTQAKSFDASRGTVRAWMLSLTRDGAIDRLRVMRAASDSIPVPHDAAVVQLPKPAVGVERTLLSDAAIVQLREAFPRLPFLQRTAIELAYFQGLTQTQIAEQLEVSPGIVKMKIRSGLLALHETLLS